MGVNSKSPSRTEEEVKIIVEDTNEKQPMNSRQKLELLNHLKLFIERNRNVSKLEIYQLVEDFLNCNWIS